MRASITVLRNSMVHPGRFVWKHMLFVQSTADAYRHREERSDDGLICFFSYFV